ncbi:hypothetical protein AVEN_145290-1 [Araneus ventricosus]|uniref:Uncharacterized protein n=1 Tax=Araneus ventricosus TaxID=182803 RepID=A0A4Y2H0M6_ARAVE|nr:hypothetical protein AVEN_145290-1 [Araneus ventricosus]
MKSRLISKRVLASPEGTAMAGVEFPPPGMIHTSSGKGYAVVGDGRLDSNLSIRAVAAIVIKISLMLWQDGVTQFSDYHVTVTSHELIQLDIHDHERELQTSNYLALQHQEPYA